MLTTRVLKTFRRRLTNLSRRNRSLVLTSLPGDQFLDLHETDFLLNKPSFSIIADLVGRKAAISLCDVLDARQQRSNEVSRRLRRIERTVRFINEEWGTEDLFVGWPFVRGKFLDGSVVHCPLLFFPVQLEQSGKHWRLLRRGDELGFLNPTLAVAYGHFNQVKLPDEVIDKDLADFDKDSLVFRTQLYEWLKTTPLEVNFNQELFSERLHFFDKETVKGLDQLERTGELKLYPEAVLGIFPQAGSFLVPDYDELIRRTERSAENEESEEPIYVGLPLSITGSSLPLKENKLFTPLPMDASQEAAIRAIRAGQSLVVQGPPGTGKSQLIANLMADAAARGKRVLLVCQKRAALDVVYERLSQVGMAPFMALVHDFQDDRKALYAQVADQIVQIDTYRQVNNSLNAVLLERDFDAESRRIDESVSELQIFKQALFDTTVCGLSPKELYLTSHPTSPSIRLGDLYTHFPFTETDTFSRRLSDYAAYARRLGTDHPWSERISFASYTTSDLSRISQIVAEVPEFVEGQLSQWQQAFDQQPDWLTLTDATRHLDKLHSIRQPLGQQGVWSIVHQLATNKLPINAAVLFEAERPALDTLAEQGLLNSRISAEQSAAFGQRLREGIQARASVFRWLVYSDKDFLQTITQQHNLTTSLADLRQLEQRFVNRLAWEQRIRLVARQFDHAFQIRDSPAETQQAFSQLHQITQLATDTWTTLTTHFPFLLPWLSSITDKNTVLKGLQQAEDWLQAAAARYNHWLTYLTRTQIERLTRSSGPMVQEILHSLQTDFELLVESDRLKSTFSAPEGLVVDRLEPIRPQDWLAVFQNSLRLAWLEHLEQQHPELRSVSSLRMEQTEQALQESIRQKQALSRDILLIRLREQTYRNLTFNRLNNVVSYRDLLHQTTKKRSIWPVRKLLEQFADEIVKLVPCWMASPESVSAIFPLRDDLFDLVIFDEASQCFAESGVPAMFRGRQLVVTGDNQQLRPSDLYRTRIEEEPSDDWPVSLEVESLLELAVQQLPQVSLTEHYRSRSLDLITFSNQHFYKNRLTLIPHFEDMNRPEPAIRYLNVNGIWQQNTNQIEAEAVVGLIDQLRTELPEHSIGVVTFNYPQQQLIQELLETSRNTDSSVLVKNIENVQGDERDIIIFSIAYAPNERGRVTMQFGSLNIRGGANRLNVAVTRARERIYVVTSLWPEQLQVENSASEGPLLLKAYLTYARNVAEGRFHPQPRRYEEVPKGYFLKDRLAQITPDLQPELPFADLTAHSGERYASVILTDDDAYYNQTVKASHAYQLFNLQTKGWPFRRIWSRQYWQQLTN
ncbi:superfamily I DNA and RNA helicase and helicase subunits-like protein [Fibrisoma limi BUZ 3]|uniref:Superfamily I DNA and RNA helicase and helicase subunits-like protein n=1 Tax=Fibrisoma limi BUZ 3 TaxID=1185876 RepID=I2GQP9_9BACT|nr:AAA domain-containing protein [Fibrisoma limi]CCH56227.1 superfamily I DNA and RNA helicase and helicase subunits-like protein [Fibrisoma limi BUZ 3]